VKVHYATSGTHAPVLASTRGDGVPDTVALAGDLAQDALDKFSQWGYKALPSDASCSSNGGDAKLDIYLVKFGGADGTTAREACQGKVCASYLLVESTFTGRGYATATEGFQTVVPHEVFHAVQNAYDADLDRFWAEGTAQWAMKTLRPTLKDLERNLPSFFAESQRSPDVPPAGATAGYLYGSAVWPLFLAARFDADLIRQALEQEASLATMSAIDAALVARGSALATEYPLFVAWNACTGPRAGTGGYPDAKTYPQIKTIAELGADGVNGVTTGYSSFTYHSVVDAPTHVSLETDAARNAGVLVPMAGGKCELDRATKLPATNQGEALVVVAGITARKNDAAFALKGGPPPAGPGDAGSPSGSATGGGDSGGCGVGSERSTTPVHLAVGTVFLGLAVARRRRR
jgi:MYXO-CTERM domain-containing protein